jgi:hypothetical protein
MVLPVGASAGSQGGAVPGVGSAAGVQRRVTRAALPRRGLVVSTALGLSGLLLTATSAEAASGASAPPLFPPFVADVPGRAASAHFTAQLFFNGSWTSVYVFETTAKESQTNPTNGYFSHLAGWTASWVSSFLPEAGGAVLLRVRRAPGLPAIASAVVHPQSSGAVVVNVSAADGVTLSLDRPARIAVDFDGVLDATDTGPSYAGPPIHTFCWFVDAAPTAPELPDPQAPATVVVRPGDPWPTNLNASTWPTVVFAPGVHRAAAPPPNNWTIITAAAQTRYFLCAGAVVHAAVVAGQGGWGQNGVVVDGFGVLSGEEMDRGGETNNSPQGLVYSGLTNSSVLGITLVDFPNHHLILGQEQGNAIRNVKVLGWRANGDGLHVFGTWQVSDLFLRTQDDSMYLACGGNSSTVFERVTTWNDANGCSFIFSAGGGSPENVTLRDSDVIYARASWAFWSGGRIFCSRGAGNGAVMSGVVIDGVRVEDRLPTLNWLQIDETADGGPLPASASFSNVVFANVVVANYSTVRKDLQGNPLPHGIPNLLFAQSPAVNISNVAFVNVTLAGLPLRDAVNDPTIFNISAAGTLFNVTVDGEPIRGG